jgi:hypothetical protein
MLTFFINTLKTLPTNFWHVFGAFLGLSSVTTPIAAAFLIANSGSINYSVGDTQIMLQGKQLSKINESNLAKLEEQLKAQNQTITELTEAAKEKNLEQKLKPELKQLQDAVVESEMRLEDVQDSQEELNDFVKERTNLEYE